MDTFELTGCTVGAGSATCEPPPLGDGEHVGHAEIRDVAGNVGTVEYTFYLQLDLADQDPPSVSVTAPSSSIVVDDSSPEIRVAFSDADSGVDLSSVLVLVDGVALVQECSVGPAEAVCEPPDLAQGSHEVEGRVADLAGNLATTTFAFEIQLTNPETDPPLLDVLGPSGTVQDDTNPEVQLQYSDAGSGIALSSLVVEVDGIPVTTACQIGAASAVCPSPTLSVGSHQVDARISDLAGNETTDQSLFDIVLTGGDSTPPTVTVDSPASVITSDTARFTVLYSDAESGVSLADVVLSLDGAPLTTDCSIGLDRAFCDLAMLTEGVHTASASVPDLEGNTTTVDYSFTVDLTPPDLVAPNLAVLEPAQQVVDDPQPSIRVEYSDAYSGVDTATVDVVLDGLDITGDCTVGAGAATCTPAPLDSGSHLVEASVADLVGNVAATSLTFELVLTPADLVAPTVTLVEPSTATVSEVLPVSVELTYSDDASGIDPASLSVIVDGTDVSSGCQRNVSEAACTLGVLGLGAHTVDVEIADVAGNLGSTSAGFEVVQETDPPFLDIVTPADDVVRGDATPEVQIEYSDSVSGVDTGTLTVTLDGADFLPECVVDTASAMCEPPALVPGVHEVTAQISDLRGNVAIASRTFEVSLDLELAILSPSAGFLTTEDVIDVSGTVSPEAETVTIHGVAGVISGDTFTVDGVELHEGTNTLTAIAQTAGGGIGSATVAVVRDTTAPRVVINSPPDGFVTTSSQVLVTGDYIESASSGSAFTEATVTVNGVPAQVENRTFVLPDHLLQPGENRVEVEATDAAGNVGSAEITVTLLTDPTQKIEELLGNGQTGTVGQELGKPLMVRVTDGIGNPLSERLVQFEVTRGDGSVRAGTEEGHSLTVRTDDLGRAEVELTLGERAGMGNHEVTVTSVGFPGSLVFCASAEPLPAERIVRIQGNHQTGALFGAVGKALPKPLFTQVFDEMNNPVAGVPVTYEVVTGGGSFDGAPTLTTATDAKGVATAIFTLGPEPGVDVHVVSASIEDGSGGPAVFNITGLAPGPESQTTVSGIVLDNQDDPVPNVTMSLEGTQLSTVTDAEGRFQITGAPVGTVHLVADGRTTTRPGNWALLKYEMVTVSGQDNQLGNPVRLLPINPGVMAGGDEDVVIPLEGVPGATLTVYAHSATFPDGSKEGLVSFTQVHRDKVPMVPPLGSTFSIALTIQPTGTLFDPPAKIQIPNPGYNAGEVVDIYGFDHDLGEFVPEGTGTVTADGQYLISNPGSGVHKAGWHGPALANPSDDACGAGSCTICVLDRPQPTCDACDMCTGDGCKTPTLDKVTATAKVDSEETSSSVVAPRQQTLVPRAAPEEDELTIGVDQGALFDAINLVGKCAGTIDWVWSFGDDSAGAMERSVTHAFESAGTFLAQVTGTCQGCPGSGSVTDSVSVKVVKVNLQLQNLPEEDQPTPNEIDPGGVVALNNDDDDGNGKADLEDPSVSGEDDLQMLRLDVDRQLSDGMVELELTAGVGKVKVWDDKGKSMEIELPKTWDLKKEEVPETVWIEGVEASDAMADVTFVLHYENDQGAMAEDEVHVSVLEVDLDIDSDNTNPFDSPAGTDAEDAVEDVENDPSRPGKYVVVNDDDDDEDAITDFADGFNLDGMAGNDDDVNPDEMFVPMELKLPAPIDLAKAKIRLMYDASDPAAATAVPVPQDPPALTIPDYRAGGGHLRLWTTLAAGRTMSANVKSGGQFVAPDTYTPAELGVDAAGKILLYAEAIEASASVADQRVLVEVDPDGDAGPRDFILQDAVRMTLVRLEVRDTADGNRLIEGGDNAYITGEPEMPQLTARFLPSDLRGDIDYQCSLRFEYDRSTPVAQRGFNCMGTPDLVELPAGGGRKMLAAGATWNVAAEYVQLPPDDQFFGGDGYIKCESSSWVATHEFRIRGRNPDDAAVRMFIDTEMDPYWYAYAISKHESRIPMSPYPDEIYNQFDLRKTAHAGTDVLYTPLLGHPDGRGLMQVDYTALRRTQPTACLTKTQIWNWQENVKAGKANLDEKNTIAENWLNLLNPRKDRNGNCVTNSAGDNFPHGQRPQSSISGYIGGHPGSTTATVYGTNPLPCVASSAGRWLVSIPPAMMITHAPIFNCTFAEMAGPGVDGDFEDAVAIKCYNGCHEHFVSWDNGAGNWSFDEDSIVIINGVTKIIRYVDDICMEVDP